MSQAIILIYINIPNFVLINELEKGHSMIETHRSKNVNFFQRIITFVLSRKIIILLAYYLLGWVSQIFFSKLIALFIYIKQKLNRIISVHHFPFGK